MDYDRLSEKFPHEIKSHLDIMLAESGLQKSDPLIKQILIQIQIAEVIEGRRRKGIYVAACVICLLSATLGWIEGKREHFEGQVKIIQLDTGSRTPLDARVKNGKAYVVFQ